MKVTCGKLLKYQGQYSIFQKGLYYYRKASKQQNRRRILRVQCARGPFDEEEQNIWDIRDNFMTKQSRYVLNDLLQEKQMLGRGVDIVKVKMDQGMDDSLLTLTIQQTHTIEDLTAIVIAYKNLLNHIHISAASNKMAKMCSNDFRRPKKNRFFTRIQQQRMVEVLHILAQRYQLWSSEFTERTMVNTLWGLSKAGYRQEWFYSYWIEQALYRVSNFVPRQIALSMWSLANRGWKGSKDETQFVEIVLQLANLKIRKFELKDVCMLLWSIAKNPAFIREPAAEVLFMKIKDMIENRAPEITAQGITNILWAYGNQRYLELDELQRMLENIALEIVHRIQEFDSCHVGNIVWSFMQLRFYHYEALNILMEIASRDIWDLQPLAVSNLLIAFAYFRRHYEEVDQQFIRFFMKAQKVCLSRFDLFDTITFSNVIQSYGCMAEFGDAEFYEVCSKVLRDSYYRVILGFEEFQSYSVSQITLAYGKMQFNSIDLFKLTQARVESQPKTFTHVNLLTILYGFCLAQYFDFEFMKHLMNLLNAFETSVFTKNQVERIEKIFEVVPQGDKELDRLITKFCIKLEIIEVESENVVLYQTQAEEQVDNFGETIERDFGL
eukprot:TRINITY_DN17641_c0_g1_i3.p1 TRINITY_DN17641_c0_g1~~TRINITY_DN17641_c0_g1_i3.p1  ORF type:complete len:609 (-),score=43.57 TRINITY_DN17641_c0_g1_i3:279-2105(-)